jgi:hypothetical protein
MSDEPRRLLDDPGTPAELRQELEAEVRELWHHDAAAGLAALSAAIQSGSPPLPGGEGPDPGGGAGPGAAPAVAAAKGGVLAKGLVVGLATVGLAAGLTGAIATWSRAPTPAPTPTVLSPETPTAGPIMAPPPEEPPAATADPAPPLPETKPAPTVSARGASPAPVGLTPSPRPQAPRNAEEIEHMIRLREKAASDPAAALRLAEEGRQRFAGGLFSIEREFIAIESLARLGRLGEARRRGEGLIAAHPSSPYADRVRAVLGER